MLRLTTILLASNALVGTLFAQAPGSKAEYDQVFNQAKAAYAQNDYKEASRLYQQCLSNAEARKDEAGQGASLRGLGIVARHSGDLQTALSFDQKALAVWTKLGGLADIARSLNNVGGDEERLGQYAKALEHCQKALQLREKVGNPVDIAQSVSAMATLYSDLDLNDKALEYDEKSLRIREKIGNPDGIADSLGRLGFDCLAMGRLDLALEYQRKVLGMREKLGNLENIAWALFELGWACNSAGRYDEALDYAQKGLAIREKLGNQITLADSLQQVGWVWFYRGKYDRALECAQQALAIREKLNLPYFMANSLDGLGTYYGSLGQNEKSIEYLQRALAINEKLGNSGDIASSLDGLALTDLSAGHSGDAMNYELKAIALRRKIDNPRTIAASLTNAGLICVALGTYDQALEFDREGLSIFEKIGDAMNGAMCQNNLAELYSLMGRFDKALESSQKAVSVLEKTSNLGWIGESLSTEGDVLAELHQFPEAEQAYSKAVKTLEELSDQVGDASQIGAFQAANQGDLYARFAELRVKQGREPEALAIADRGRAQGLAKQIAMNAETLASFLSPEDGKTLLAERRKLVAAAAKYRSLIEQLEDANGDAKVSLAKEVDLAQKENVAAELRYDLARDSLYAKYPDFKLISGEQPASGQQLVQLGRHHPDTLYLEYALMKDKALVFAIHGATGLSTVELPLKKDVLRREVKAYLAAVQADESSETKLSKQLYAEVLSPLEKYLSDPKMKHIVIVADGPLLDLPFGCLTSPDGKRLIERGGISSAVSLGTFVWRETSRDPIENLLVVADPTGEGIDKAQEISRGGFGGLPAAREEGRQISSDVPGSKALFGREATEADVKKQMPNYALLHFACHGYLNSAQAMRSALVLAKDSDDSGFLEAGDIAAMPLSAQMAVLSACETGEGVESGGEGLMGLTWAFRAAGVPCVVASKWQVDDAATARIMVNFYRQLKTGAAKDDAIRSAVLAEMAIQEKPVTARSAPVNGGPGTLKRSSVYYWGAFQIVGDCSPLKPLPK